MPGNVCAVLVFITFSLGFNIGGWLGNSLMESEAIERGHMVQCVGKSGWHWECE